MPDSSIIDSLQQKLKRSVSPFRVKPSPVLSLSEGAVAVMTYTPAADKMKIFSAFILEGLENGDMVNYNYPDDERETVRAKLKEQGINVEKYERNGALRLRSLTEYHLPDGTFDKERSIKKALDERAEAKTNGYKRIRELEDLGDFSFLNSQWQTYVDYWDDPRWETPSGSYTEILSYTPFVIELTAFNVKGISEAQLAEMLKAFWVGNPSYTVFIDLLEDTNAFSNLLDMPHQKLVGRKILLEFDPASDYEKIVDSLAKEAIANVEPMFVFTLRSSILHTCLAKRPWVRFFLLSTSISTPESTSENETVIPAKNPALILDSINRVLEEYPHASVFLVFDKLSDILELIGPDRTYRFLHYALDMLTSARVTATFLVNTLAHEPQVISQIRGLFPNLLIYRKGKLEAAKISF